ncbi:uncharacterized protein LOC111014021 isoform X2 [Momordica charantia]|uniref:Uncharacterized protein LOC111014021 isoform X2 n=1 Tax=Momordica charantia TaxID=3673 RepID=A0A6J1CSY6_MOMCH|nr:uncharacterized protein LOC111014021 isoform X2 [Momordica charantia]
MAATRFFRPIRPSASVVSSSASPSPATTVRCMGRTAFNNGERGLTSGDGERRKMVTVKAAVAAPETVDTKTRELDLGSLLANLLVKLKTAVGKTKIQDFIEKGSFIVAESYLQYFHGLSQKSDQNHTVELLIQAIDMFLVGTALFVFGVGLFAMFVGPEKMKEENRHWNSGSNLFGLFYMKKLPTWVGMESVSAVKSKIGHAVVMILQVGVLEKFKSIPLNSAADLACFAAAVLISSASIFFLSKLNTGGGGGGGE